MAMVLGWRIKGRLLEQYQWNGQQFSLSHPKPRTDFVVKQTR
jgi:hypothetical protein